MRKTEIARIDHSDPKEEMIAYGAAILRDGGLVAFPTDTVYALGVDGFNEEAVKRLFLAKRRAPEKPLIFLVKNIMEVKGLVSRIPLPFYRLVSSFWPGGLTLILPASEEIPEITRAGRDGVGIRMPDDKVAIGLINELTRPIATTSANLSTFPSSFTPEEVLRELNGRIDLLIDCGRTKGEKVSTILDLTSKEPLLIRDGIIPWDECQRIIKGSG